MKKFDCSYTVPFKSHDMYQLVNDIDRYSQFLPWCRSSRVIKQDDDALVATIEVAKAAFSKSFTIRHRLQQNKMVEVDLVEGPFRHFKAFWHFETVGDESCKIRFFIEYAFSGKLLEMVANPIFSEVAEGMVDSFVSRAHALHGHKNN